MGITTQFLFYTLKGAVMARKLITYVPYSETNKELLNILYQEGYILGFKQASAARFEVKLNSQLDNRWLAQLKVYQEDTEGGVALSNRQLKEKNAQFTFAVVTNAIGFMPLTNALHKSLGGKLVVSF